MAARAPTHMPADTGYATIADVAGTTEPLKTGPIEESLINLTDTVDLVVKEIDELLQPLASVSRPLMPRDNAPTDNKPTSDIPLVQRLTVITDRLRETITAVNDARTALAL